DLRTLDQGYFESQDSFVRILHQTNDVGRMVDDLLIIKHADVGRLLLDRKILDIRELGARLPGVFALRLDELGGSTVQVSGSAVFASVDPDRLRRALAALVENSIRHSQRGVAITIEATVSENCAAISVSDNGPGLDFEQADNLFERFHRGETRGEGSGLG